MIYVEYDRNIVITFRHRRVVRASSFQDPIHPVQQLAEQIQSTRTVYILTHIQSNPFPSDRRQAASFKTANEKYLISLILKQQWAYSQTYNKNTRTTGTR